MARQLPVPVLESEAGLNQYMVEIRKFPILTAEEEYSLAQRWQLEGDRESAHKLVTSHLRLVAKIALGYRGYGLPLNDLIAEGNIGMMQAVKRFESERGFRLATYAMWWIKASIQEYILRSWSLVKLGTTSAQKKLFFNLRRMKAKLSAYDDGDMSPAVVKQIATNLMVDEKEVVDMNRRLAIGDASLNAPIRRDGEGDGEWLEMLEDERDNPEELTGAKQERDLRHGWLHASLDKLGERERYILIQRRLLDSVRTLEELSQELGISRERVRQIEARAFSRLESLVRANSMMGIAV